MVKEKYFLNLSKQFDEANGINKNDINSREYISELKDWLNEMSIYTNTYKKFLLDNGLEVDNYSVAEVNKGALDSIISEKAMIISPYGYTFGDEVNSELVIENGFPVIRTEFDVYREQDIETYITQNPYGIEYFKGFDDIHKAGLNICLGVYGRTNDKDMDKKIKLIESFKEKLKYDNLLVKKEIIDNIYLMFIKSNRKVLRKSLSL